MTAIDPRLAEGIKDWGVGLSLGVVLVLCFAGMALALGWVRGGRRRR